MIIGVFVVLAASLAWLVFQAVGAFGRMIHRIRLRIQEEQNSGIERGLGKQFYQAGLTMPPIFFFFGQAIGAVVGFGFMEFYGGFIVFSLVMGVVGWFSPRIILNFMIDRRKAVMNRQVRVFISSMANTLQTEGSVRRAMAKLTYNMQNPLKQELVRILAQQNIGGNTSEGIRTLGKNLDNKDLEMLATALYMDSEEGGPTREVIMRLADTMRLKERMRATRRAENAGGAMIAALFLVIPIIFFLAMPLTMHSDWVMLKSTIIGHAVVGIFMITEIVVINLMMDISANADI